MVISRPLSPSFLVKRKGAGAKWCTSSSGNGGGDGRLSREIRCRSRREQYSRRPRPHSRVAGQIEAWLAAAGDGSNIEDSRTNGNSSLVTFFLSARSIFLDNLMYFYGPVYFSGGQQFFLPDNVHCGYGVCRSEEWAELRAGWRWSASVCVCVYVS